MPTQKYVVVPNLSIVDPELQSVMKITEGKEMRVSGVTTIIGRFKEAGGLIFWAWDLGKQGLDYRQVRDAAGDAGTLAHAMVEADIRGGEGPDLTKYSPEMVEKSQSSFSAYLEWKGQTKLLPYKTEMALISKKWLFGGCLDAIQIEGKIALLDWKTSNAIYQDNIIQVGGGYQILWEENFPELPITGGIHILRFSKIEGDFTHHVWQNLDIAKRAFLHMRILFEIDKNLKTRL